MQGKSVYYQITTAGTTYLANKPCWLQRLVFEYPALGGAVTIQDQAGSAGSVSTILTIPKGTLLSNPMEFGFETQRGLSIITAGSRDILAVFKP